MQIFSIVMDSVGAVPSAIITLPKISAPERQAWACFLPRRERVLGLACRQRLKARYSCLNPERFSKMSRKIRIWSSQKSQVWPRGEISRYSYGIFFSARN